MDDGTIAVVPVSDDMAERLKQLIDGRPVYVHFDCDVLEPGTVPTDYLVPGGMTLTQLNECAQVLASGNVVGIEIAELEGSSTSLNSEPANQIVEAFTPLLTATAGTR